MIPHGQFQTLVEYGTTRADSLRHRFALEAILASFYGVRRKENLPLRPSTRGRRGPLRRNC
jgi:hypothetical protein